MTAIARSPRAATVFLMYVFIFLLVFSQAINPSRAIHLKITSGLMKHKGRENLILIECLD